MLNLEDKITIKDANEEIYLPYWFLRTCCNDNLNGEINLLKSVIKNCNNKNGNIFDIGAHGSTFPSHSDTHNFHLFDPVFDKARLDHPHNLLKHDVNYDKDNVFIHKTCVNDTDFRLDTYCEKNNISKIDFLKIDTDGHDLGVINGLGDNIECEYIQIEYDMNYFLQQLNIHEILSRFKDWHFFYILPDGMEEFKLNEFKHDFLYINIFISKTYPTQILKDFELIINKDNIIEVNDLMEFTKSLWWEVTNTNINQLQHIKSQFLNKNTQFDITTIRKQYYSLYINKLH